MISSYKLYGRLVVILITYTLLIIIPPKRLVVLFYTQVYGAEGLNVIPQDCSYLRVLFLYSLLSNLIVLTLRLYLKQIYRIKSLSTYSISFSLLCVIIKYRKVLLKKVLQISITRINLACAFLKLVQLIQRLRQGLLIFYSKNLLKT